MTTSATTLTTLTTLAAKAAAKTKALPVGALLAEHEQIILAALQSAATEAPAPTQGAIPITPDNPPRFPCWLWRTSASPHWQYFGEAPPKCWLSDYSHWFAAQEREQAPPFSPDQPTAPTLQPEAASPGYERNCFVSEKGTVKSKMHGHYDLVVVCTCLKCGKLALEVETHICLACGWKAHAPTPAALPSEVEIQQAQAELSREHMQSRAPAALPEVREAIHRAVMDELSCYTEDKDILLSGAKQAVIFRATDAAESVLHHLDASARKDVERLDWMDKHIGYLELKVGREGTIRQHIDASRTTKEGQ